MIFKETDFKGAYFIELEKKTDERGFFARAWCQKEFEEHNLISKFVQCNLSYNKQRDTLRGMHFQLAPCEEAKLVRCIRGAIFDVIIDLRPSSPTNLRWIGVELTSSNYRMLYVPEGFAHGYITLTDDAEVFYQVSQFYSSGHERGIRWDDPTFKIDWPIHSRPLISEKDMRWPDYKREPKAFA